MEELLKMQHHVKLLAKDCARKEDTLYFIASKMNLIYSLDMKTSQITLITCLPEEKAIRDEVCGAIAVYERKIILTPNKSREIGIYDMKKREWKFIERKELAHIGSGAMLQIIEWKDSFYFIGSLYPAIIKFDKDTETIKYIEEPYLLKKMEIKDAFFRSQYAIVENKAYFASCIDNSVLEFNLDTEEYQWITVGNRECKYSGIIYDGNFFWLAPRTNSAIVRWDGKKEYREIRLPYIYDNGRINYFLGICFDGHKIILPCMIDKDSLYIDKDGKLESIDKRFSLCKQIGKTDIMCQDYTGNFTFIHNGEIFFEKNLIYNSNKLEDFFKKKDKKICDGAVMFKEGEIITLDSFLEFVSNG